MSTFLERGAATTFCISIDLQYLARANTVASIESTSLGTFFFALVYIPLFSFSIAVV